ncbi:hypothetical protein [Caulobacter sp. RHG1]|uniref:hypothetical protein n=1 Tax=Caulobacter sp. (strain RHG1) TaxID=2545762 RepID=UPI001552C10A|nr:hypothetical protein [Caulobacter sp. RHG1]NQE64877.1 hypothetical protein [Caulobacter sp. RHG1]
MSKMPSSFRRVWTIPILVAIASLVGLVSALLGDGVLDWISWIGLGAAVVVLAWALVARRT